MKMPKKLTIATFTLVICLTSSLVYAQDNASSDDEWRFEVTPYFWAPDIDGDSTINGVTTSLDLSFDDIMDNFDVWGLLGRIEAWKGDWGIILDGSYLDVEGDFHLDTPGPSIDVGVDLEMGNVDLGAAYRLFEAPLGGNQNQRLWFDLMGGGRYAYLEQEIDLTVAGPLIGKRSKIFGGDEEWVEPFVGGRVGLALTKWLAIAVRGDVSGFGIGSASDLTWNLLGGIDLRFSEWLSLKLGYKIYDIDYERGSGRDKFGLDGQFMGPIAGLTFYF